MSVTKTALEPVAYERSCGRHSGRRVALETGVVAVLLVGIAGLYGFWDSSQLRRFSLFPWDSGIYQDVASQLLSWQPGSSIEAPYPWGPRVVFPGLLAVARSALGGSWGESAYVVSTVAAVGASIVTFVYWRRNGVSNSFACIALVVLALTFHGPIRTAAVYPGGGFAFEMITIWLSFGAILLSARWRTLPLALVLIFVAGLSREFSAILVTGFVILRLAGSLYVQRAEPAADAEPAMKSSQLLNKAVVQLVRRPLLPLLLLALAGLLGGAVGRLIVADSDGTYNPFRFALAFGWFHLNLGETSYMFVYALGPLVLMTIVAVAFRSSRSALWRELSVCVRHLDLLVVFSLAGIIFAFIGGTDSDRFLLWMVPFYGLIGLSAGRVLWSTHAVRVRISLLVLLGVTILWTRFYVPAIPPLLFPEASACAPAGVRTNYNPEYFVGPPLMEGFRGPLRELPSEEAYVSAYPLIGLGEVPSSLIGQDETDISCAGAWVDTTDGPYRLGVNALPVPFGFPHNQYELLIAHPAHGVPEVRAMLLSQWVVVLAFCLVMAWRPLRTLDRESGREAVSGWGQDSSIGRGS